MERPIQGRKILDKLDNLSKRILTVSDNKRNLHNRILLFVLTYRRELWMANEDDLSRIVAVETALNRMTVGIRSECNSNKKVYEMMGIESKI